MWTQLPTPPPSTAPRAEGFAGGVDAAPPSPPHFPPRPRALVQVWERVDTTSIRVSHVTTYQ